VRDSVMVGLHCQTVWSSRCKHGTVNETTGVCTCDRFWNDGGPDGGGCNLHEACYYHGFPTDSSLDFDALGFGVSSEGYIEGWLGHECYCYGCWTGRFCNESVCRNGGRCQDASSNPDHLSWECDCVGVWDGKDCTICPETCREHGNCPVYWPERFLTGETEVGYEPPTDERFYRCWACKGHWGGERCEICVPPPSVPDFLVESVQCNRDGEILGCDGLDASETTFKWLDECGNCESGTTDRGQCTGCAGVTATQGEAPQLDACGVCGGLITDACLCDDQPIELQMVWGLKPHYDYADSSPPREEVEHNADLGASLAFPRETVFDLSYPDTQAHLLWVCEQMRKRRDLSIKSLSRCVINEWRTFLRDHVLVLDYDRTATPAPPPASTPAPVTPDAQCETVTAYADMVGTSEPLFDFSLEVQDEADQVSQCRSACCGKRGECESWSLTRNASGALCTLRKGTAAEAMVGAISGQRFTTDPRCTWVRVGSSTTGSKTVLFDVGPTRECPAQISTQDMYRVRKEEDGHYFEPLPADTPYEVYSVRQAGRHITVRRETPLSGDEGWWRDINFACCDTSPTPAPEPNLFGTVMKPVRVEKCVLGGCPDIPAPQTPTEVIHRLQWPYPSDGILKREYFAFTLYKFAEANAYLDQVGFSHPDPSFPGFACRWLRMIFKLPKAELGMGAEEKEELYRFWQRIMTNVNYPHWSDIRHAGLAFQWSQTWIDGFTVLQAQKGTTYVVAMSCTIFFVITLCFTCSITLTLLATLSVVGTVIFVFSSMGILGYELGPAEQIGVSVMTGIGIEYTVHITEGYLEYLHATQSSLLAVRTTRERAVAGTLQRTGVPIMVSAITMVLASCIILACKVLIYRRIAEIMIINVCFSAFHALVVFTCLIMTMGPTTVQRTWYHRWMLMSLAGGFGALALVILFVSGEATGPGGEPLFE